MIVKLLSFYHNIEKCCGVDKSVSIQLYIFKIYRYLGFIKQVRVSLSVGILYKCNWKDMLK